MLCWMFDVECADDESVALANDGLLTGGGVAPFARSRRRAACFRLTRISLTALRVSTSKRVVSCAFTVASSARGNWACVRERRMPPAGAAARILRRKGMGCHESSGAAGMFGPWRKWSCARPGFRSMPCCCMREANRRARKRGGLSSIWRPRMARSSCVRMPMEACRM